MFINIEFTCGDKNEAVSIIREAAQWLIDIGKPMWRLDDLTFYKLNNPLNEFIVIRVNGISAAAMTLSFEDKFFWPNIKLNTSGFIHKLSVRREYAGKGYAKMLVDHAKKICLDKKIYCLRLDCDPHRKGLNEFYLNCGFTLVEIKTINTNDLGTIDLAMYEMNFS